MTFVPDVKFHPFFLQEILNLEVSSKTLLFRNAINFLVFCVFVLFFSYFVFQYSVVNFLF